MRNSIKPPLELILAPPESKVSWMSCVFADVNCRVWLDWAVNLGFGWCLTEWKQWSFLGSSRTFHLWAGCGFHSDWSLCIFNSSSLCILDNFESLFNSFIICLLYPQIPSKTKNKQNVLNKNLNHQIKWGNDYCQAVTGNVVTAALR
jgi:hypothetical protein